MHRKGTILIRTAEVERLRAEAGLSLAALAAKVPVDVRTLQRWLKGAPVYIQNAAALANAFEVETAKLIQHDAVVVQEHTCPVIRLTLQLDIPVSQSNAQQSPQVTSLLAFLQTFLPESGIRVTVTGTGLVVIVAALSPSIARALSSESCRAGLREIGVSSVNLFTGDRSGIIETRRLLDKAHEIECTLSSLLMPGYLHGARDAKRFLRSCEDLDAVDNLTALGKVKLQDIKRVLFFWGDKHDPSLSFVDFQTDDAGKNFFIGLGHRNPHNTYQIGSEGGWLTSLYLEKLACHARLDRGFSALL